MLTYPILLTQVDPYTPPPSNSGFLSVHPVVGLNKDPMVNKRMSGYIWLTTPPHPTLSIFNPSLPFPVLGSDNPIPTQLQIN